jgi:hypothetical protein
MGGKLELDGEPGGCRGGDPPAVACQEGDNDWS